MKPSLKLIGLMTLTSTTVLAGSLDPPSAPGTASSAMYSLSAICDRLNTGAVGSLNAFTEPTSGPGATGCTLNDVMTKVPALDETNGATPADVATGKKFWGLKSGSWGVQTGTRNPVAVPRTGQTTCYDANGAVISCTGTGQDGEFQKGVALPSPRFTDNTNGTVTDNLTGLIWLTNANCIKTNNASFDADGTAGDGAVTWQHALDFVAGLNVGTYLCGDTSSGGTHQTDWRLPNRRELDSLVDLSKSRPALTTGHPFSNVLNDYYWAGSTNIDTPVSAWVVNLLGSDANAVTKTVGMYYVWPVRGGQ